MLFENLPNLELRGNEFVVPSADHLEKFITRHNLKFEGET